MKNEILSELHQMKYLFDYRRGKVISEQTKKIVTPFSVNFGNEFESGRYSFNPDYSKVVNDKIVQISDYIRDKNLKDFKLVIRGGESQVPNQPPFGTPGSLAQKRAEVLKSYLEQVLVPTLPIKPEIEVAQPIIGSTPWNPNAGDTKDDEKYKREQFVRVDIDLDTEKELEIPPIENPNKGFVINVRGDWPGGKGAYYFPKTLEDWKKITYDPRLSGFYSNAEQRGTNYAGTTVNMDHATFLKYWLSKAPDLEPLIGPAYLRDVNNQESFILKK